MGSHKHSIPQHVQNRLARIHVLTYSEMQRLFSVISDLRDRALFLLAYRHGLRASEIEKMETPDVDFSGTKLLIRRISRGSHHQHPLQKDESLALQAYLKTRSDKLGVLFLGLREKRISRRGLDWLMKAYGAQAKLPEVKRHFHALKHTVAVHLLAAGVELHLVHQWLGHSAIKNTAHYVYLASPPKDPSILAALLGVLPA
jgi:integrase